ncbi:0f234990-7226-48ad-b3fd-1a2f454f3602 [Thermothielavioides terrestris]|uniref:0f234990-7226-48ad-b3fd-1a2f454f3602 n=1 Tax=Thermothielavioides terrestris TaxID=2587410 RepID=A0A446B7U2_9PEZI|nr:0f234990-7226-48ad-b3fd-1a2f454f3602 [Thermothielavioides terrestris]
MEKREDNNRREAEWNPRRPEERNRRPQSAQFHRFGPPLGPPRTFPLPPLRPHPFLVGHPLLDLDTLHRVYVWLVQTADPEECEPATVEEAARRARAKQDEEELEIQEALEPEFRQLEFAPQGRRQSYSADQEPAPSLGRASSGTLPAQTGAGNGTVRDRTDPPPSHN